MKKSLALIILCACTVVHGAGKRREFKFNAPKAPAMPKQPAIGVIPYHRPVRPIPNQALPSAGAIPIPTRLPKVVPIVPTDPVYPPTGGEA